MSYSMGVPKVPSVSYHLSSMSYHMGVAKVPSTSYHLSSTSYHLSSMSYHMGVHDYCVRGSKVYLAQFQPTRVLPFFPPCDLEST